MKNKTLTLLGTLLVTAVSTNPVYADNRHTFTDYARVTHVQPLYKYVTVRTPQRSCETIRPNRNHNHRRYNSYNNGHSGHNRSHNNASAVIIGGVIGGAIGHHVTRAVTGSVNNSGTLAGAVLGSAIAHNATERGNSARFGHSDISNSNQTRSDHSNKRYLGSVQSHNSHSNGHHGHSNRSKPRQRCVTTTVERQERRADGYSVTYSYKGHSYQTRMDHNPGNRIRVSVQIKPH